MMKRKITSHECSVLTRKCEVYNTSTGRYQLLRVYDADERFEPSHHDRDGTAYAHAGVLQFQTDHVGGTTPLAVLAAVIDQIEGELAAANRVIESLGHLRTDLPMTTEDVVDVCQSTMEALAAQTAAQARRDLLRQTLDPLYYARQKLVEIEQLVQHRAAVAQGLVLVAGPGSKDQPTKEGNR